MSTYKLEHITSKPNTYAVSKLKTYSQCSELYRLRYIEGNYINGTSAATLTGNLCHEALEIYHSPSTDYTITSIIPIFLDCIEEVLRSNRVIDRGADNKRVAQYIKDIVSYVEIIQELYDKASPEYDGKDAIRTKDGKVPSNPTATNTWKNLRRDMGLDAIDDLIRNEAKYIINLELAHLDIKEIVASAHNILKGYTVPSEVISFISVELPLSKYDRDTGTIINPVLMPLEYGGDKGIYLTGFIDWVGRVNHNGREGIAIVDYKSGSEDMSAQNVIHNPQLYTYVYAYERLTHTKVDFMGIHNLRSNTLVLVDVNRCLMEESLRSLFIKHKFIQSSIDDGLFHKHQPDSAYSPCLNQFGNPCPYIGTCHPDIKL